MQIKDLQKQLEKQAKQIFKELEEVLIIGYDNTIMSIHTHKKHLYGKIKDKYTGWNRRKNEENR